MTFSAFLFQALNGLSTASGLFFVAGRPVADFRRHPHHQYRPRVPLYAGDLHRLLLRNPGRRRARLLGRHRRDRAIVGVIGASIEILLLRRIYRSPELFQLLATFALVLVINDADAVDLGTGGSARAARPGPARRDRSPRPPVAELRLFLISIGPVVLLVLHLALARTRFGRLVRAATQDREMVGALGVNQASCSPRYLRSASFLAGLGGALQVAREPANLRPT